MKFDIVPYKIDETTVIVGVVIYRGSNTYGRFVKRVEELQEQLESELKERDTLKEKLDRIKELSNEVHDAWYGSDWTNKIKEILKELES